MSDEKPPFNVIPGGFPKSRNGKAGELHSPEPPPGANLTTQERRVWNYICDGLRESGIDHRAAGITIKVICQTYVDWLDAIKLCTKHGRYLTSKNGDPYDAPHSNNEKRCKQDLLKWLPEACLTIPSMTAAQAKLGDEGPQDDLFGDLVTHAVGGRNV
ncbi:P27 family phage terminase small subunit [Silvimonas sp.]|uniref:P27 family phage terminase small subunit n=1 Tax=Silvimonas sp. TaxID=2650811 RepID=UPI00283EC28D|nr:P27 family phage terminase small subunit [Silvimonas sp.]MDR3427953.1 P27 family phage terminase small subunit [Silvimonas sp.]